MILNSQKEGYAVEIKEAGLLAQKLRTPLDARGDQALAARFLKGGYGQDGYGVPAGAAIDGSHAFEGTQGYYVKNAAGEETGKSAFLGTVEKMRRFFKRRGQRIGKPIRYVIKPGIGGQHTAFQGIADVFQAADSASSVITGEYELGKDFEKAIAGTLKTLNADWSQIALIPSSKSGSTDETMMIFTEIFTLLLREAANRKGLDGSRFAEIVLDTLHEVNFDGPRERPARDLFKVDSTRFGTDSLTALITDRAKELPVNQGQVRDLLAAVLGNMFFETTDRPDQSRLSAFIRNSGLDTELGEDSPESGAMFDNVGGRWTGDLHMMAFLAFYDLDAEAYWTLRQKGIRDVREGKHAGNRLGHQILDENIREIVLLVPDPLFWVGKSVEQNFNESIWQNGFANLVAVRKSEWRHLASLYQNAGETLVINMTDLPLSGFSFRVFNFALPEIRGLAKQKAAQLFADLFTTFYGMTNTVGTRLIARELLAAGFHAGEVDLNQLDRPATQLVQRNLFLLQPYVELGKGLLEKRLGELQGLEAREKGAMVRAYEEVKELARQRKCLTNAADPGVLKVLESSPDFKKALEGFAAFAARAGRKLVPFIYLQGEGFQAWRAALLKLGIPWIMQGTGDQHISYQQILAQPRRYWVLIISFVPENPLPGRPAIGFAKGYLHGISSHLVRDAFAEASYRALTDFRQKEGGLGLFLRLLDRPKTLPFPS